MKNATGGLALDRVSLQVSPGEFVTIVGPNGGGKSTLLKCIAGLIEPDSGQILRAPGIKMAYVPQKFVPNPLVPLSVRGFLSLGEPRSPERILEAASLCECEGFLDQSLSKLSGGQMQRALMARALTDPPDLLLLDEPMQGLDFASQPVFYDLIESLHRKLEFALMMVSHDLHLVMASSHRVLCLQQSILCEGQPEALIRHPEMGPIFGMDIKRLALFYHHHTQTHD